MKYALVTKKKLSYGGMIKFMPKVKKKKLSYGGMVKFLHRKSS